MIRRSLLLTFLRALFLVSEYLLPVVSSHDRGKGIFSGLFYKDTNPTYKGPALMT